MQLDSKFGRTVVDIYCVELDGMLVTIASFLRVDGAAKALDHFGRFSV